jgi:diguanylate cyclase (GGDEF)-like protein/PAS domain S-box-containing protein
MSKYFHKVSPRVGPVILALLVVTLLVLGGISYRGMVSSRESNQWVRHTHEVLEHLQDLLSAMQDIELSSRAFVITGNELALKSYRDNILQSRREEAAFRNLTLDNPVQQSHFPTLHSLAEQKIQYAERAISLRRMLGSEAAADFVRDGEGQPGAGEYREVILQMQMEEMRLLAMRDTEAKSRLGRTKTVLIFGTILGLLIALAASGSVHFDNLRRGRAEDALFGEKERAQVTLNCIGDAVICTDISGKITFVNIVAEKMTGWSWKDAVGRRMTDVFRIIDGATRKAAQDPMTMAVEQDKTVGLTQNCVLLSRDGCEYAVEDSAAPIHDRTGRVTGGVIVFHDVTTSRAIVGEMKHLAEHDVLTDLPNRLLLKDRIAQAVAAANRNGSQVAVMFIDLDQFKHINDSLGHAIGDKLLQSVAGRLISCVRGSDTVSRQGGDEFVVLLSEIRHATDAGIMARKIIAALAASHAVAQHNLHVTVSIGVSTFPADGVGAEMLMKNADTAMYQAKEKGRNNYQFFRKEMNLRAINRQSLEGGLREALEHSQFVLHYQPKIDLTTGLISGLEALVRWMHPTLGLIPPLEFLPIAEDCNLILPVGRWVLKEACRQVQEWIAEGLVVPPVAINVSSLEFRSEGFVETIREILGDSHLDPHDLELELTETVLMQHAESTLLVLSVLKAMGVRLAVDDFGTGYSSLSYLKRLPIDSLKIDQSFVRDITSGSDDVPIVRAVITMAKSLKQRVVGEGVETQEQMSFLQAHGCDEAQGYYFSEPLIADGMARLLRAGPSSFAGSVHSKAVSGLSQWLIPNRHLRAN